MTDLSNHPQVRAAMRRIAFAAGMISVSPRPNPAKAPWHDGNTAEETLALAAQEYADAYPCQPPPLSDHQADPMKRLHTARRKLLDAVKVCNAAADDGREDVRAMHALSRQAALYAAVINAAPDSVPRPDGWWQQ